jgi:hypothetical protein
MTLDDRITKYINEFRLEEGTCLTTDVILGEPVSVY